MRAPSSFPLLATADILVVGGGSAGCLAGLAARHSRKHSVLLIERYGFLGGTSTQMLDTFYGFFTPGEGSRKIVGGMPDQVVDGLDRERGIFLRPNTYGAGTGITYHPELLKLTWDGLLASVGVRVLLHTQLVDVETDSHGRLRGVLILTRGGFYRLHAQRFIDASGDAELCHPAGIGYEKAGELEPAQTLTTTFRLANVDFARYEQAGGKTLLARRMAEAVETGTHPLPRKSGSLHPMCLPGCAATVAVRVSGLDPLDPDQLTAAEMEGRRQAFVYERFLRARVPGFEGASIVGLSHQIGVRETRRVYGEYRLTRDDCLSVRRFPDVVCLCGAPIEDHRPNAAGEPETEWAMIPDGQAYDVPYRTLVPQGRDEVWIAGRCFSATHAAHASCRSMGQTMAMGQAAGGAASLSLARNESARELAVPRLQDWLLATGAILETPRQTAFTGADEWKKNRRGSPPES